MSIDVIIPTSKNIVDSNYSLLYTIKSLLSQTLIPNNIIISENLDGINTENFIKKEFGNQIKIISSTRKSNNISFARNNGAKIGNSNIILFIDDDVIIGKKTFLKDIVDNLNYVDFYCGAKRYWAYTSWRNNLKLNYDMQHIRNILKERSYLPNAIYRTTADFSFHNYTYIGNFGAIKRSVFEEINGFDEAYEGWSYQDTDLMMRLVSGGYNYDLMSNDEIFVYHLTHEIDKHMSSDVNRKLFLEKQKEMNIKFNLNFFFGIFAYEDELSIVSKNIFP